MNAFNIERAFKFKEERGWKTIYVAVDLHGTLIRPYHDKIEFYPGAVEVMKWFNSRPDFKVIIWTSSYTREILEFLAECDAQRIGFDFVNKNPLEKNSERACFDEKFYFNILLDDKAGFDPETDWALIKSTLQELGQWHRA